MSFRQNPPQWRVFLTGFLLFLPVSLSFAHQQHPNPFSGKWVLISEWKGEWKTECSNNKPMTIFFTVHPGGTVTQVSLLPDQQASLPAALVITPAGEVIGSIKSGLRDSHDFSFMGMLFHKRDSAGRRIGAGYWFSGYGCEGTWIARQTEE